MNSLKLVLCTAALVSITSCKTSDSSGTKSVADNNVIVAHGLTVGTLANDVGSVTVVSCKHYNDYVALRSETNGKPDQTIFKAVLAKPTCRALMTKSGATSPVFLSSVEVEDFKQFCVNKCSPDNSYRSFEPIEYRKSTCRTRLDEVFSVKDLGYLSVDFATTSDEIVQQCFAPYSRQMR